MKPRFYTVVEIQINEGTPATLSQVYTGEDAEKNSRADYHTRCAAAAISAIEYHSVVRIDNNGRIDLVDVNDRRE